MRYALVPKQRVAMQLLLVGKREVRQAVHRSEIERAGRSFDGIPFQRDLRRQAVALAQYRGAQIVFPHDLFDANRRAEVELVPGEPAGQGILGGMGRIDTKPCAGNRRGDRRRKHLPPRRFVGHLASCELGTASHTHTSRGAIFGLVLHQAP